MTVIPRSKDGNALWHSPRAYPSGILGRGGDDCIGYCFAGSAAGHRAVSGDRRRGPWLADERARWVPMLLPVYRHKEG